MLDLILRGGRVIDPGQNIDATMDVGFADGRVAGLASSITEPSVDVRECGGMIVAPGFIDLHTHVYWGGTSIGVDGPAVARRAGVTTLVDAGSTGAANFLGLLRHVIEPADTRILAFLNVSYPGIYAYGRRVMVGECADLRLLDAEECVLTARAHPKTIVGIKVRLGRIAGGASGMAPLDLALEAAEETGLPVMAHIDNLPPRRRDVLAMLRPGDILTHCFKPFPNAPLRADGEIWEDVKLARERGVIFDLGHGAGSFGFRVAEGMLAQGFLPDVLSSDVHALNIDGPVFDLAVTLSKFVCLGLSLPDVIRTVTAAPARAIRRPDLGTLAVGQTGDATVFTLEQGSFTFLDCLGEKLDGRQRIAPVGSVTGGVWREAR